MARGVPYTPQERLNAAYTYVLTGNLNQTSHFTGIPERTLKDWISTEWFQDLMLEAQSRKQEELDGQWTGLIHLIAEKLEDRIKTGDPVIDKKTGEVTYLPVKAKDLAIINSILIDKRAGLRSELNNKPKETVAADHYDKIQEKLGKVTIVTDEEDEEAVQ